MTLLTPFPTLNLPKNAKLQNKAALWSGKHDLRAVTRSIYQNVICSEENGILSFCASRHDWKFTEMLVFSFPPPQIMRKGVSSSGRMMEVPAVVVLGGQGYLLGVNPGCQLL